MRKRKSQLNRAKVAELQGKNPDAEIVLNKEQLDEIGDEIILGAMEGFNEELENAPEALKSLAVKFSDIINEFFIGFSEGVREELALYTNAQNQSLEALTEGISDAVRDGVSEGFSEGLKGNMVPSQPEQPEPYNTIPQIPPTNQQSVPERPVISARDYADASSQILRTRDEPGTDKPKGFVNSVKRGAGAVGDFGIGFMGGLIPGMGGKAEKYVEDREKREEFIRTESKLRESEYKERGMSKSDIRKELKSDYKTIQKEKTTVKDYESKKESLLSRGYSEEQADTLLSKELGERNQSIEKIAKADRSRVSLGVTPKNPALPLSQPLAPALPPSAPLEIPKMKDMDPVGATMSEEDGHLAEQREKDALEESEKQTSLLEDIKAALGGKKVKPPEENKGGFSLGGFGGGIGGMLKTLFNPRNLLKLFTKFLAPAMIIGSLANGIIDGVKEFVKTGSIKEAIIAGFGGILEFLSFGLFDKETVRGIADFVTKKVDEFIIQPITSFVESVAELFDKYIGQPFSELKNFFSKIVTDITSFVTGFEIPGFTVNLPVLGEKKFGPWKPFAKEASIESSSNTTNNITDKSSTDTATNITDKSSTETLIDKETIKDSSVKRDNISTVASSEKSETKELVNEIAKGIVIQAPPATVVPMPQQSGPQIISPPFTSGLRSREPSVNDFLRSRYSF
jgi:hypothetical protein